MELATILSLVRTLIAAVPAGKKILRLFSGGLSVESIDSMHSGDDDAMGFKVLLKNASSSSAVIRQIELSGFIKFSVNGFMAQMERQSFHVELDATDKPHEFEGRLRADPTDVWFSRGTGRLVHVADTGSGYEWWRYSLTLPVTSQVPAQGIAEYKLLFRRKTKQVVSNEGGVLAMVRSSTLESRHTLKCVRDDGKSVTSAIDRAFATFIVNWPPIDLPADSPVQDAA